MARNGHGVKSRSKPSKDLFSETQSLAKALARAIGERLYADYEVAGDGAALTRAIAKSNGGAAVIERRKLARWTRWRFEKNLSADELGASLLSWIDLAALQRFWSDDGGFAGVLWPPSIAQRAARVDHVITVVPSLMRDHEEYVPVADVRAATVIRQSLQKLNPTLRVRLDEVAQRQVKKWRRELQDFIHGEMGRSTAVISLGSPRTNRLSFQWLQEFFDGSPPFAFRGNGQPGADRYIEWNGKPYRNHAIVCCRYFEASDCLEVVVAGDRSAATLQAARALADIRDVQVPSGTPVWALISVAKAPASEKKAYQILPGFPRAHESPRH